MSQLICQAKQFPTMELANEEDRIYRGYGSVEIKDSHGDMLPISQFMKVMPTIMDRGGIILDSHSNRPIGKILNYQIMEHPEEQQPGILLTVKNYKGTNFDDLVWNKIKSGEYTGFSFGGMSINKPTLKFEEGMDVTKVINEFEGFEFSAVGTPANKASIFTEINYLAKSLNNENEYDKLKNRLLIDLKKELGLKPKSEVILNKTNKIYRDWKITKSINIKKNIDVIEKFLNFN